MLKMTLERYLYFLSTAIQSNHCAILTLLLSCILIVFQRQSSSFGSAIGKIIRKIDPAPSELSRLIDPP